MVSNRNFKNAPLTKILLKVYSNTFKFKIMIFINFEASTVSQMKIISLKLRWITMILSKINGRLK